MEREGQGFYGTYDRRIFVSGYNQAPAFSIYLQLLPWITTGSETKMEKRLQRPLPGANMSESGTLTLFGRQHFSSNLP